MFSRAPKQRVWLFAGLAAIFLLFMIYNHDRLYDRARALRPVSQSPVSPPPPQQTQPTQANDEEKQNKSGDEKEKQDQPGSEKQEKPANQEEKHEKQIDCERFAAAEDFLIVMKTGASEVHRKLPVHFETTLRCIPHFVIFSDLEEALEDGTVVHDVLEGISSDVKNHHEDFEFYRLQQEWQTVGRNVSELSGAGDKRAWNLDKWKFVPMMGRSIRNRPSAKWFFFIETDTAVVWSNLFTWIKKFDPEKPWYIGGPAWAGDTMFAHGGTGWIMSKPAVQRIAEKWTKDQPQIEERTTHEWAGDKFLADVLKEVEVPLTPVWPILQGETPSTLDYTPHHWCYPVVTYHHMHAKWVETISKFDEEWARKNDVERNPMRHRDGFEKFVSPYLRDQREDWDNLSKDEANPRPFNPEDCKKLCEEKEKCLQWSFTKGECRTGDVIRLGAKKDTRDYGHEEQKWVSGWMMERFAKYKETEYKKCTEDLWITGDKKD